MKQEYHLGISKARVFLGSATPNCLFRLSRILTLRDSDMSEFDLLTATATGLQGLLMAETLASVQLVRLCQPQISKHNKKGLELNAIISTPPEAEVFTSCTGARCRTSRKGTTRTFA